MPAHPFMVHCCQFYRPPTSAINCLAFDKTTRRVALSRADSCIEIWTIEQLPPCRERTLPYVENASVEALAWCRGRLFATGLDGFVREWSPKALWPVNSIKVTPSAAWCMASNQTETHLAVGTEEGALQLVAVTPESVHMEKCLTRSGDRILSVAWSQDGRTIATGSVGIIRVWDVLSGRCLSRMTVSQSQSDMKTLVWSIAITQDSVIISGDSRGVTSFWDLHTSTLINSYQSHTADVLSVCWNEERKRIFSSGIEPVICQYNSIKDQVVNKQRILGDTSATSSTWVTSADATVHFVENVRLNFHTHDVRCLLAAEKWLVSGGVDGVLTFSNYPPSTVLKFYPFNPDHVSMAAKGQMVLFQYPDYLELWRLGSTETKTSEEEDGQYLPVSRDPEKLAQVKCKNGSKILCSAIDDSGQIIAYSDGRKTNIYSVKMESEEGIKDEYSVVIQPIKCLNATIPGASALCFATSSTMFLGDETGFVQRVEIDDVICRLETVLQPQANNLIRKLVCNRVKPQVAAITMDNQISVIDCVEMKVIAVLPHMESLAIDVKFIASGKEILALYADGRLVEVEIGGSKKYTDWSKRCKAENVGWQYSESEPGPLGVTASPVSDSTGVIIFSGDKLAFIAKSRKSQTSPKIVSDRFRHICKVDILEDDSIVIVQVDEDRYLADLPPSLRVKKYGTG